MAAYTVSNPLPTVFGDRKALICRMTGDGTNYTSGGDIIQPSWFGMKYVDYIIFQPMDSAQGNLPIYLRGVSGSTPKMYIYTFAGAQYSGANSLIFDVIVVGQ